MTPAEFKDWASAIVSVLLLLGGALITIYARLAAVRSKQQLIESRANNVALQHARDTIDRMWGELLGQQAKRRQPAHVDDGARYGTGLELRALEPDEPEGAPEAPAGAPAPVPTPAAEIAPQAPTQPAQRPVEPALDTRALWTTLGAQ